jgi:DNA mismatch repair protein MutS
LFANAQETLSAIDDHLDEPNPIEIAVRELDPDSLSPKEALETLYQLKKLLG